MLYSAVIRLYQLPRVALADLAQRRVLCVGTSLESARMLAPLLQFQPKAICFFLSGSILILQAADLLLRGRGFFPNRLKFDTEPLDTPLFLPIDEHANRKRRQL